MIVIIILFINLFIFQNFIEEEHKFVSPNQETNNIMHFDLNIANQNDINIFQTDSRILIKKRMIKFMNNNWKSPIKYSVEGSLNSRVIKAAIKNIERETCLEFEKVEKLRDTEEGIKIVLGDVCESQLGKQTENKATILKLTKFCSTIYGVVQHELGHALGLIHEHQRLDNDKYIDIHFQNIKDRESDAIEKTQESPFMIATRGLMYEYASVMHYGHKASSKNGKPTIVVKNIDAYNSMLGQTESFTFTDYKLINLHHCKIECYNKMECRNGGYIAIKRCSQCICPRSYYGEKCQFFKPFFNKHCMTSSLTAKEHPQLLYEEGKKICNYHIKSENGTKILLILHESNTYNRTVCTSNYGLEIKYFEDKGLTGLCLCGLYKNIKITSEKNEVYLEYYGLNANHYFYLTYIKVCEDYSIKSKICQESSCFDIKPDVTPSIGDTAFNSLIN